MKKIAILILSILIAGLFVACNQDITVDAQTYANMEVGTFVLNGQNYATLQEAVNAKLGKSAKALGDNDGVIYLTRNASGPGAVINSLIEGGVTIDFAGYTYSFTNVTGLQGGDDPKPETFGLAVTNGAQVTLKGLEQIDLFDTSTKDLTMVYVEGNSTSLTIEDAPKMKVEDDQYVFWAANGATLTIGSTTTTSEKTEITGKIAATGTNESKPVVSFNNDTKINASELKADSAVVVINTSEASTIDSFVGANNANIVVSGTGDVTVTTNKSESAATYTIENTSSTTPGESATVIVPKTDGTSRTIEPGKEVINDNVPQEDTNPSVAMIGSTLYKTLEAAVTASKSEDTIILLKDIVLGNDAFFDIKGTTEAFNLYIDGSNHVITATSSSKKQYLFMFSDANTSHEASAVCDWGIKNITIRTTGYQTAILTTGEAFDNMSLEKVTIVSNGECLYANGPTNITAKRSSFTLDGSSGYWKDEMDSVYYSAVMVGYGGTVVLEDCEIRSTRHGLATFPSGCNIIAKGNTSVTAANEENSYALWARCDNGYSYWCAGDSTIDVESTGTISGRINVTEPTGDPSASNHRASINIKSGSFINVAFAISDPTGKYSTETNKAIKITGGTFDVDPSGYVAEGYEVVKDGDFWIVKKSDPVAVNINTGTEYYSLQKAFDEAGDGHTIKILKDIDYGTASYTAANAPVKITKSLNLDGNSHTIKAYSTATAASRFVYITNLYNTSDTPASDTADSTHITVNISNLTLDLDGSNGYAICYEGNVSGTVENCTITHPSNGICVKGSHNGNYNYIRADKTILNVKDCTVTSLNKSTSGAIYNAPLDVELGATLIVDGGSYSGPYSATTMSSGGTIILKSGNLANAINVNNNSGYGDKFIWIPGSGYVEHSVAQNTVLIEGGSYANFSETAVGGTGATLSISGGTFDVSDSTTLQMIASKVTADSTAKAVLKNDLVFSEVLMISGSLTIDGNNNTISSNATRGIRIDQPNVKVSINNLELVGGQSTERGIQVDNYMTDVTLKLDNCHVSGISYYCMNFGLGSVVDFEAVDCSFSGWAAFNIWSKDSKFTVKNSTLTGINKQTSSGWNAFSAFCIEGDTTYATSDHAENCTVTIENCTINADSTEGVSQAVIGINGQAVNCTVTVKNCTTTYNTETIPSRWCYINSPSNTLYFDSVSTINGNSLNSILAGGELEGDGSFTISNTDYYDTYDDAVESYSSIIEEHDSLGSYLWAYSTTFNKTLPSPKYYIGYWYYEINQSDL